MQISRALWNTIAELVAADPLFLSAATAMHVHLVGSAFAAGIDLDVGTLDLVTASGLGPLSATTGDAQVFVEPALGGKTVQLLEPAGGWTWEADDIADLPVTIYGYAVTDTADTGLIGSKVIAPPVTINAEGQAYNVDRIRFRMPESAPVDG